MHDADEEVIEIDPQLLRRLRAEFKELDTNGNGMVEFNEMDDFLCQRGVEDEQR